MTPPILCQLADLRRLTQQWKQEGAKIGVVPTMGALHAGHLSLVQQAKATCDRVIVTIFVNPKQFNNPDDLANYPRTERDDAAKLAPLGVDTLWVPQPDQMYPDGFATTVTVAGLTDVLCGAHRPGHFDGVATVVTKLFLQTAADHAFFGEKDYQQLQIVRRMTQDLDIPTQVIPCPTIREADGLALSSRNLRLDPSARRAAAQLYQVMTDTLNALSVGKDWADLSHTATERLQNAGFEQVEYLDLRDGGTLQTLPAPTPQARLFAAAWIGGVRLIDNQAVFSQT